MATSFVSYLWPSLVSALALSAFIREGLTSIEGVRFAVWLIAQIAIALAMTASRGPEEAVSRAIVGQVATMTVTVFCFLRAPLEATEALDSITLACGLVFAAFAGATGGGLVFLWQAALALAVMRVRSTPSHDALERTLIAVSKLLWGPTVVIGGLLMLHDLPLGALVVLTTALPLAVRALCMGRRATLHCWLRRVEAGEIGDWRVVERRPSWSSLHLDPVTATQACTAVGQRVLVAVAPARRPFREADEDHPVATIE